LGTTAQLMRSTIRCPRRSMKARFSAWHPAEESRAKLARRGPSASAS
jgi:hypothetical protein